MKFRLLTLILISALACSLAGWWADRARWNAERIELLPGRTAFALRICQGSAADASASKVLELLNQPDVRSRIGEKEIETMVFHAVLSIWSSHADINYALLEIEGVQTTTTSDYALWKASELLQIANIGSVEHFVTVCRQNGYNYDSPQDINSDFKHFVSKCLGNTPAVSAE